MSSLPNSINESTAIYQRPITFDIVMYFDTILFFLSFWVLALEPDDHEHHHHYSARNWLLIFNFLFIIDLFFRLLSFKVESLKREYWNPILPCIFTIIIWLMTAFFHFNHVFGSHPTQGFNTFLFIIYHIFLLGYIIKKFK